MAGLCTRALTQLVTVEPVVRRRLGGRGLCRRQGEEDVGRRSLSPVGFLDDRHEFPVGRLGAAGIRLCHHLVGEEMNAIGGVRAGVSEGGGDSQPRRPPEGDLRAVRDAAKSGCPGESSTASSCSARSRTSFRKVSLR